MQNLFDILEEYKIADELCANAYETCTPDIRNRIKSAIAFHFSENTVQKEEEVFTPKSSTGFCKGSRKQALENVFIFIDKNYSAPAKFLAVLCQAIRANAKQIFVCIDKVLPEEQFSLFLTCLELCGIENSYYLPEKIIIEQFALQLQAENIQAKYVFCGGNKQNLQAVSPVNSFTDSLPLSICAQNEQKEMLSLSYGNSAVITYSSENSPCSCREHFTALLQSSQKQYDISFISPETGRQNYGLGMEFCFKHPQLPQDFFYDILYFSNLEINY